MPYIPLVTEHTELDWQMNFFLLQDTKVQHLPPDNPRTRAFPMTAKTKEGDRTPETLKREIRRTELLTGIGALLQVQCFNGLFNLYTQIDSVKQPALLVSNTASWLSPSEAWLGIPALKEGATRLSTALECVGECRGKLASLGVNHVGWGRQFLWKSIH